MKPDYKKEVYTVLYNGVVKGFMTRRSVLFGYQQEVQNGWYISHDLFCPIWKGNFNTREEARKELLKT
jgi:hypothetical protein